jgi:hypothetical protein
MQKLIAIINISILMLVLIVGLISGDENQGLVMA